MGTATLFEFSLLFLALNNKPSKHATKKLKGQRKTNKSKMDEAKIRVELTVACK